MCSSQHETYHSLNSSLAVVFFSIRERKEVACRSSISLSRGDAREDGEKRMGSQKLSRSIKCAERKIEAGREWKDWTSAWRQMRCRSMLMPKSYASLTLSFRHTDFQKRHTYVQGRHRETAGVTGWGEDWKERRQDVGNGTKNEKNVWATTIQLYDDDEKRRRREKKRSISDASGS